MIFRQPLEATKVTGEYGDLDDGVFGSVDDPRLRQARATASVATRQ